MNAAGEVVAVVARPWLYGNDTHPIVMCATPLRHNFSSHTRHLGSDVLPFRDARIVADAPPALPIADM